MAGGGGGGDDVFVFDVGGSPRPKPGQSNWTALGDDCGAAATSDGGGGGCFAISITSRAENPRENDAEDETHVVGEWTGGGGNGRKKRMDGKDRDT